MDSSDGHIVWQSYLPDARAFQSNNKCLLYQLRSAVHYPLPPVAILLAQSKVKSHSQRIVSYIDNVAVIEIHYVATVYVQASKSHKNRN